MVESRNEILILKSKAPIRSFCFCFCCVETQLGEFHYTAASFLLKQHCALRGRTGFITGVINCVFALLFQVAPYCATKWAIEGLTRSVAKELPPGVAIIALSPGVVNTDMLASCFGSSAALYQTPEAWYAYLICSNVYHFLFCGLVLTKIISG